MNNVKENKLLGTAGALVGALLGGVAFFLLYQLGIFAGITGYVGIVVAIILYEKFGHKLSVYGIIISCVLSLAVLLLTYLLCINKVLYNEWKQYGLTFVECFQYLPEVISDPSVKGAVIKDIVMAIIFWALGAGTTVFKALAAVKNSNKQVINSNYTVPQETKTVINGQEEVPEMFKEENNGVDPLNKSLN